MSLFTDSELHRLAEILGKNPQILVDALKVIEHERKQLVPDDGFETFWQTYKRKGNKKQTRAQWAKLDTVTRQKAIAHAKKYIASRELIYCKDAERYLKHEVYEDDIITDGLTLESYRDASSSLYETLGLP